MIQVKELRTLDVRTDEYGTVFIITGLDDLNFDTREEAERVAAEIQQALK